MYTNTAADTARLAQELGPELTSRVQRWKDRYNAEEQASLLGLSDQDARRGLFVRYLIAQNQISEGG